MTRTDLLRSHGYDPRGPGADRRYVEAWMRLEHPTLDGLSATEFERAIDEVLECIRAAGATESEALAASFGL